MTMMETEYNKTKNIKKDETKRNINISPLVYK